MPPRIPDISIALLINTYKKDKAPARMEWSRQKMCLSTSDRPLYPLPSKITTGENNFSKFSTNTSLSESFTIVPAADLSNDYYQTY